MVIQDFIIPGNAVAKGRARTVMNRKTGMSFSYTPETTVNYENYVKMCYKNNCTYFFGEDPVGMLITVYKQIPKSTSKKKRVDMESGLIKPTTKPDIDNYYKLIADALNGVAYKDDSQIVAAFVTKFYAEEPFVHVTIFQDEIGGKEWMRTIEGLIHKLFL